VAALISAHRSLKVQAIVMEPGYSVSEEMEGCESDISRRIEL